MPFVSPLKVRFADVDAARIAFYPRIFKMLHVAFEELFEERLGVSYAHVVEHDHLGFPTVRLECDFKSALRFGERAEIEIALERLGEKSIGLRYRLRRQPEGTLCVEARATVVTVRVEDNSPVPIPPRYRELFAAL